MRKVLSSLVSLCLLVTCLSAFKCNASESVPLANVGYQLQVYTHAAAKTGNAFNVYSNDQLQNGTYAKYLRGIDLTSEMGERLFKRIDETPVITSASKWALFDEADKWAVAIDGIIADGLFGTLPKEYRNSILLFRTTASAVKVAISSITTATPTKEVLVKTDKLNAEAKKVARSVGADTNALVQRLGQIVAETTADVLVVQGMTLEDIRKSRSAKRESVRAYIQAELKRIGQ